MIMVSGNRIARKFARRRMLAASMAGGPIVLLAIFFLLVAQAKAGTWQPETLAAPTPDWAQSTVVSRTASHQQPMYPSLSGFVDSARTAMPSAQASMNPADTWLPDAGTLAHLDDQGWEYVARAQCLQPIWTPVFSSSAAYSASVAPLRQQLLSRLGALPQTPAGNVLERQTLFANERYTIEWVRLASRLPGVSVFGYLARPLGWTQPGPAVIVLHGVQTPPHTAFGWRLAGDAGYIEYPYNPPLAAVGVDLVESGYTVFVPWLDDSEESWPYYHWYEVDRWAALLTQKAGIKTSSYGILVPQVMAAVDFLVNDAQVQANQIALMGWDQGAQVAGVTAAVDERVAAMIWLGPPVDSRALHSDPVGMRYDAAFTALDCAFGQAELAALIAPHPLLFSYSTSDPRYDYRSPFVSQTVYSAAAQIYSSLGVSALISRSVSSDQHTAVAQQPLQWLSRAFAYTPRTLSGTVYLPPAPPDWPNPVASYNMQRDEIGNYLASLGECPPITLQPAFTTTSAFENSVAPLRERLIAELAGGTLLPEQPITLLERRTVMSDTDYVLEWVRFRARFGDLELGGYLATPRHVAGPGPAVLSFDNNFNITSLFGLDAEPFPYVHAYGDKLARAGYVVFAPYMPSYLADGWGVMLLAKTGNVQNIWNYLLPLYMSGVDFLRSQPNVDSSRIAAYGISYAGVAALYTTALDQRISTLVYSDPTISVDLAFLNPGARNSPVWQTLLCSHANRVQQWLIAPRRFIWETGEGESYRDQEPLVLDPVRQVYRALNLSWRFQFALHIGAHETFGGFDNSLYPLTGGFTIFYPPPVVNAIFPSTASALEPITVTGANFLSPTVLMLGTLEVRATWINSSTLSAMIPASFPLGTYTVTVVNPDGYLASLPNAVHVSWFGAYLPLVVQ